MLVVHLHSFFIEISTQVFCSVFNCCLSFSISQMNNDVEHVFMCLSGFCISSLEKCSFKSFPHFLFGLLAFLLLSCRSSTYIMDTRPDQVYNFQILSPSFVGCLFIILIMYFDKQVFNFDEIQSIIFFLQRS